MRFLKKSGTLSRYLKVLHFQGECRCGSEMKWIHPASLSGYHLVFHRYKSREVQKDWLQIKSNRVHANKLDDENFGDGLI